MNHYGLNAEVIESLPKYTYIDRFVQQAMKAEMQREEEFVRAYGLPLIAMGYRFKEISICRERMHRHPSEDVLSIQIIRKRSPFILMLRRQWRKVFPYKIPTKE